MCSVSSYVDLPLSAAYCASKAALLSATNVARMELEPLGVSVMGVHFPSLTQKSLFPASPLPPTAGSNGETPHRQRCGMIECWKVERKPCLCTAIGRTACC